MINISSAFRKQLNNDNRRYIKSCDITLSDGATLSVDNSCIWSNGFKIEGSVSGEESFDIGSAVVGKFTLILNNIYDDYSGYDFTDAVVSNIKVGLKLDDGTAEYVKKGVFTVDETTYNGSIITLQCLDNMSKFDRPYSQSNLIYPATLGAIVRDACSCCGVSLAADSASFDKDDYVVQTRPDDGSLTFRHVLCWVGQISCHWCRCNENGELSLGWYDTATLEKIQSGFDGGTMNPWTSGDTLDGGTMNPWTTGDTIDGGSFEWNGYHHIYSLSSMNICTDDVVITGIRVLENGNNTEDEDVSCLNGSEGYILSIEDNDFIESGKGATVAGYLGEKLIGLRFRPLSVGHLSDPSIEAGDVAVVTDRKGNSYPTLITSTTFTAGNYQRTSCEAETPLRNSATRFSQSTRVYQMIRKLVRNEKTAREMAVDKLNESLKNSSGMYSTEEKQEDGSTISYLHDKPTLKESKNVIKLTSNAIGMSNDGGKTYPFGFILTGELIAKILYTNGINADYIDTGRLEVKDKDGNTIFLADMDTAQVIISGDCVKIGNKTATQAIQDVLDNTEKAIVLTMSLDNEYQGIPTDHEGNYEKFPDVQTKATVMYGHTDVTADCTYSVAKSTGVEGTWDADNKVLTVTSLQSDSGWVDISATYIQLITVTKRFNISKVKNGADGRIFFIESNTSVIKQGKDHTTPPEIVANAYYRDGLSAERTIYKGRFVVEETSDGKIWNTIYTSSEDETTITHYLYAFLDDGDGNIVTDEEGNAIAFVRDDIQQVRISLYAAGATATLLDRQTYVVILDVDSLTHEEIFNLLTNNGAVKVLYKIGNQVFFSFDYARGGELVLGGKNNGNGILRVLDENDTEIGKISRNGMALYRKVTIDNMDYDIEIDTVKSLVRTSFPNVFGEGRGYAQLQGNSCSAEIGDFDEINSSGEANLSGINNLDGTTNISGNNSLDGTTELKGTTNIYDLSIYSSGSYLRLAPDGKKIAYSSSSSKRYKKHMGYVTVEQAEGLYEIPVVWFQYKNGYLGEGDYLEGKDIPGLYAEDVSAFLPEAASIHMKKKDDSGTPTDEWQIEDWDMKTVIPLIIKLLQDQKEKIDKLTERVTTLEGGI